MTWASTSLKVIALPPRGVVHHSFHVHPCIVPQARMRLHIVPAQCRPPVVRCVVPALASGGIGARSISMDLATYGLEMMSLRGEATLWNIAHSARPDCASQRSALAAATSVA